MFLLRLAKHSKSPVKGDWQISDDPANHRHWLEHGNVGLALEENGLVAVDYDTVEQARAAWVELVKTGLCNLVSQTRNGAHFLFTGKTRTRKFKRGDYIKGNGYIVWPPSVVRHDDGEEWEYRFVLGDENTKPLPFPEHLFPEEKKEITSTIEANVDRLQTITRAMHYASAMPASIEFQGGDRALWIFACRMVRQPPFGFGLTIEEAWPIALMFNERCQPPWKENTVKRKLLEAKKRDH